MRNIGDAPATGYDRRSWAVWQRRDDARVDGIATPVDVDCFNGGAGEWRRWITAGR